MTNEENKTVDCNIVHLIDSFFAIVRIVVIDKAKINVNRSPSTRRWVQDLTRNHRRMEDGEG